MVFGSLGKPIIRKNYIIFRGFFNNFLYVSKITEKVVSFIEAELGSIREAEDVRRDTIDRRIPHHFFRNVRVVPCVLRINTTIANIHSQVGCLVTSLLNVN